MAMVPSIYTGLIMTNTAFVGPQAAQLANGIAVGFTTYLTAHPANIITTVGDVGAPGAGVGNGVLLAPTCTPPILYGILEANLKGAGLLGPQMSQFALGLASATCTYLASAQTVTAHAGVGAGVGIGSIIGIEPAGMAGAITAAAGFTGVNWPQMVLAISSGLVTFMMTNVKYTVVIAGPAGPGVSSGTGSGRLL